MKELHVSENIYSVLKDIAEDTEPITIYLAPGEYYGRFEIRRPNVTLVGEGANAKETIISYDMSAKRTLLDGTKCGTFRSYTMLIDGDNITLRNLSIRNTAGPGNIKGQAIALYAEGENILVEDCIIKGYQSTLFTGPLPPKESEPGEFIGPKESSERKNGRQYYKRCLICGDEDFIFGSAEAYFEKCEIKSVGSGCVTAASTPEGQRTGYVFENCRFTCGLFVEDGSVYIGKPWRDWAKVELVNCELGRQIAQEGFHDRDKINAREHCYFSEQGSYGPGAAVDGERASFVHVM